MQTRKDILALLGRLGLKEREGRIYLACLQHSDGLYVHEITSLTRTSRSTVDLVVKRLVKRGFLTKVKVGRRLHYSAQSPDAILFRQKQLVDDLEQAVPLLSRLGGEKKDMEILHLEGAEGFRQVHQDVLLHIKFASGEKKDVLSFSSGVDSVRLFPEIQKAFINKRVRNGSWYRAIAPASSARVQEWTNDPKALRQVKYMPDRNYPFDIDTHIYADNLAIYSTTPPIGGVIIRNQKIANSMRAIFHLVWDMAGDQDGGSGQTKP